MVDKKVTVAVLDNQPVVRHGVISILHQVYNIEAISESCGGQGGLEIIEKLQPDIVILEIAMPGGGGRDCIAEIRKVCPEVAIIIFSTDKSAETIMQAIKSGAKGYVLKTDPLEELQQALHSCLQDELYLSPTVSAQSMQDFVATTSDPETRLCCLTKREYEVAHFIYDGRSPTEIAGTLYISPKTVRVHRKNIMRKLSCKHGNQLLVTLHNLFHWQTIT
jgi:DNA-binding NarL/FixJ family response regulator